MTPTIDIITDPAALLAILETACGHPENMEKSGMTHLRLNFSDRAPVMVAGAALALCVAAYQAEPYTPEWFAMPLGYTDDLGFHPTVAYPLPAADVLAEGKDP